MNFGGAPHDFPKEIVCIIHSYSVPLLQFDSIRQKKIIIHSSYLTKRCYQSLATNGTCTAMAILIIHIKAYQVKTSITCTSMAILFMTSCIAIPRNKLGLKLSLYHACLCFQTTWTQMVRRPNRLSVRPILTRFLVFHYIHDQPPQNYGVQFVSLSK